MAQAPATQSRPIYPSYPALRWRWRSPGKVGSIHPSTRAAAVACVLTAHRYRAGQTLARQVKANSHTQHYDYGKEGGSGR